MKSPTRISAHVEPILGEEYRYWADSDVWGTPPYLVDLIADFGLGVCTCRDYDIAKRKMRKEGETDPIVTSCKHIRRARLFWASQELIRRASKMPKREVEE